MDFIGGYGDAYEMWQRVLVACAAVTLAACSSSNGSTPHGDAVDGGEDSGAPTANPPDMRLNGNWSCKFSDESMPITVFTWVGCNAIQVSSDGTDLSDWFTCPWWTANGNVATLDNLPRSCGSNIDISEARVSVFADGNTLTIHIAGDDPYTDAGPQTLNGTCTRSGSQVTTGNGCIDAGSDEDAGGSTWPPPAGTCNSGADCPGSCVTCEYHRCFYCAIGTLGVCTC